MPLTGIVYVSVHILHISTNMGSTNPTAPKDKSRPKEQGSKAKSESRAKKSFREHCWTFVAAVRKFFGFKQ